MTGSQITEALTSVGQAVDVPPVDEVAFATRLRATRRRRFAGRTAVGGAVAAAAASVALVVTGGQLPVVDGSRSLTDTPGRSRPSPTPSQPAAVSLRGELYLSVGSDLGMATDLEVEAVLGSVSDGAVVVDRQSRVMLVPVDPEHQPGVRRPDLRPLAGGQPVLGVRLDQAAGVLAFVDLDDQLHLRDLQSDQEFYRGRFDRGSTLVALNGGRWVEDRGDELRLWTPEGAGVSVPGDFADVELGSQTLAARAGDEVRFFDVTTGQPLGEPVVAAVGSLAPRDRTYVAGLDVAGADDGSELALVDLRTGGTEQFEGWEPDMRVREVSWQNDDRLLVLADSAARPGTVVLWDCSAARMSCRIRMDDPSGTMRLPSG